MFLNFFTELRAAKVPVTLKEYLALMEAMDKGVIDRDVEDFYYCLLYTSDAADD